MKLETASAVIDALGGTKATAELTSRSQQQVSSWRSSRIASSQFLVMQRALKKKGYSASPELWGVVNEECKE